MRKSLRERLHRLGLHWRNLSDASKAEAVQYYIGRQGMLAMLDLIYDVGTEKIEDLLELDLYRHDDDYWEDLEVKQ